jgi:hypothetical protein
MQLLRRYKEILAAYDEDFDWRVFLLRTLLGDKGRVLEVGGVSEEFSRVLTKDGYEVESAESLIGGHAERSYDAVVLWDVLENSPDPRGLTKQCVKRLKDNGLLLIRIIDSGSLRNEQEGEVNSSWGHLNYLTQDSLETMIRDTLRVQPMFVQIEAYGQDFLICAARKDDDDLSRSSMRALMVAHSDAYLYLDSAPGPRMRIFKTMLDLRRNGTLVDLAVTRRPQVKKYDLVHIFHHAWRSVDNVKQALCAKSQGKAVVVSAIYMDLAETSYAQIAIPKIFNLDLEQERELYLKSLSDGSLELSDIPRNTKIPIYPGIEDDQKTLFTLADHLIGLSFTEIRQIGLTLGIHKPFTIVPNCADPTVFSEATADAFVEKYGIEDFVITVGHMEVRKNQLMLLYALRNADIPVVVVGNPFRAKAWYCELCRYYASERVVFIPQLSQKELASAFAAARVHALPSWTEGASLANIEAAMAGCNVVASNRAGEIEYFGNEGFYCNPASISSIREAVEMSYRLGNEERRNRLRQRVMNNFTFRKASEETIVAYEQTLSEAGSA